MYKKRCFVISLCLLSLLFMTGCGSERIKASAVVWGTEGSVDGTVCYTPGKELYFNMRNNTDRILSYSLEAIWEKSEGDAWEEVFTESGVDFMTLLDVEPGKTAKVYGKKVRIGSRILKKDEKLPAGRYRVRFNVIPEKTDKWDNTTEKERAENISFEFEVK